MIKKQFTLYMENKPGTLASITRKLAAGKINIEGISVSESTDVALIQIVSGDVKGTKKVLTDASIPFTMQDVVVVALPHRPGALSEVVSRFAKVGVNINYVYATACDCNNADGCHSYAIISAPNLKKVEEVWNPAKKKKK